VWGKRFGAVLVAVALVAGALLLRRNVIEGSDNDTDTTTPITSTATPADTIVCASELEAACLAIAEADPDRDVVVEPAGVTLDRLATLEDGTDAPAWLTISPFPAMVDELRATPLNATVEVLGASQLSVATPAGGRSSTLDTACAGSPLWRCIGEHAGEPWTEIDGEAAWNTIRPSLGAVEREAVALASFADAVAGYFGSPEISSTTFSDPAFIAWLRQLTGPVDESQLSAGTPLATMAVRPLLDVAATTEAERSTAGGDRSDVNYPDPTMWVEAVLAVPEGVSLPDDVAPTAAEALAAAGWADPSTAAQPVPGASTMLALRSLWGQL
jgi:hypothetical protein